MATWAQSWAQSFDKWMMFPPPPPCGVGWGGSVLLPRFIRHKWVQIKQNRIQMNQTLLKLTTNQQNLQTVQMLLVTCAQSWTNGRDHVIMGLQPGEGRAWGWGPYHWGGGQGPWTLAHIYIISRRPVGALCDSWEDLIGCKILLRGVGMICPPGKHIS